MSQADFTLAFAEAGDSVYALAAAGGLCFAACGSGLYRSLDSGGSWQRLAASDEHLTTAVALSPAFEQDGTAFAAVKGGILRSSDGGDAWFTSAFPAPPPLFSSLAVSPDFERDGMVLAGTLEDGIFSSSDRGVHWQPWNFGLFDLNVLCLALSSRWQDDETVYAGTETGLYRSGNGGRAWRFSGFPSELAPVLCLASAVDPASGAVIILAGSESSGLLASCDDGESWDRLAADALPASLHSLQVQRSDGGPMLYALTDDSIMRSDDLGASWSSVYAIDGTPTAMLVLDDCALLGIHGQGIMRLPMS